MDLFKNFISEYGTLILYTILTTIAGSCAAFIKKKYTEKCNTKTKKEVVADCVKMVQQLYKDLDGEEKKQKAEEAVSAMLEEKGITITPLEINVLIEASIAEFKDVFNEDSTFVAEDEGVDAE